MPFISSILDQNIYIIVRDIVIFMLLVTGVINRTNFALESIWNQFYKCLRDIYKIIFKYIHILQVENLVVVPTGIIQRSTLTFILPSIEIIKIFK